MSDTESQSYSIPSIYTAWKATTTLVWFRASRLGQYTGILVLRQFLKIEQTLSHGHQLISLLIIKHTSILINYRSTLSVLLAIITLFIDFIVYLYPVFRHLFSPYRDPPTTPSWLSDQHP
jgi:uncharacterized membrane protein YczE